MKYTEAILSNTTRKLSSVEISKMLIAVKFSVLFIMISAVLSFPIVQVSSVIRCERSLINKHLFIPEALLVLVTNLRR